MDFYSCFFSAKNKYTLTNTEVEKLVPGAICMWTNCYWCCLATFQVLFHYHERMWIQKLLGNKPLQFFWHLVYLESSLADCIFQQQVCHMPSWIHSCMVPILPYLEMKSCTLDYKFDKHLVNQIVYLLLVALCNSFPYICK